MPYKNPQKKKEHNIIYYQNNRKKIISASEKWAQENSEKRKEYIKRYKKENREKILEDMRKYSQENKKKKSEYDKKYRVKKSKTDVKYRLDKIIACSIRIALKGKKEGRKWEGLVGYTIKNLMEHLEKQFDRKMNWNNHGSYWHIDHIKPKSLFCYKVAEDEEFKKCWSLDNLQPLEAVANLKKSNHY